MAVQFTGLIEWLPGWLVLRMGCFQYFQDPRFLEAFSEPENENISFQGASDKEPFQKLTSTKQIQFPDKMGIGLFSKTISFW